MSYTIIFAVLLWDLQEFTTFLHIFDILKYFLKFGVEQDL